MDLIQHVTAESRLAFYTEWKRLTGSFPVTRRTYTP